MWRASGDGSAWGEDAPLQRNDALADVSGTPHESTATLTQS